MSTNQADHGMTQRIAGIKRLEQAIAALQTACKDDPARATEWTAELTRRQQQLEALQEECYTQHAWPLAAHRLTKAASVRDWNPPWPAWEPADARSVLYSRFLAAVASYDPTHPSHCSFGTWWYRKVTYYLQELNRTANQEWPLSLDQPFESGDGLEGDASSLVNRLADPDTNVEEQATRRALLEGFQDVHGEFFNHYLSTGPRGHMTVRMLRLKWQRRRAVDNWSYREILNEALRDAAAMGLIRHWAEGNIQAGIKAVCEAEREFLEANYPGLAGELNKLG